jgi:hypothetical protein
MEDSTLLDFEEYKKQLQSSLRILDLVVGKKYMFVTKEGPKNLGEFYERITEIENFCWHDGPEICIKLIFEIPFLENKNFYSLHEQGFVEIES